MIDFTCPHCGLDLSTVVDTAEIVERLHPGPGDLLLCVRCLKASEFSITGLAVPSPDRMARMHGVLHQLAATIEAAEVVTPRLAAALLGWLGDPLQPPPGRRDAAVFKSIHVAAGARDEEMLARLDADYHAHVMAIYIISAPDGVARLQQLLAAKTARTN